MSNTWTASNLASIFCRFLFWKPDASFLIIARAKVLAIANIYETNYLINKTENETESNQP